MTTPPKTLDELESIARAATQTKWLHQMWCGTLEHHDGFHMSLFGHGPIHRESELSQATRDMDHIAAFYPPTVLELIARARLAERLEKALDAARESLEVYASESNWYARTRNNRIEFHDGSDQNLGRESAEDALAAINAALKEESK